MVPHESGALLASQLFGVTFKVEPKTAAFAGVCTSIIV